MREIKFRAWDKKQNKMFMTNIGYEDFSYHIAWFPSQKLNRPALYKNSCLVSNEEYELMQYTGLKDKNDVEIYEGDIVFDGFVNKDVVWHNSSWRLHRHYIINDEDGYREGDNYGCHLYDWISPTNALEVIGNIYENSELLE